MDGETSCERTACWDGRLRLHGEGALAGVAQRPRFFDLPLRPELTALCGRDSAAVASAAGTYGFSGWETDWERLVARDDIDVVDICTPGDTHAEIAIAALEAGKHVLCEKPLANTVEQGAGDGRGGRACERAWPVRDGRLQLPPRPRARAGPADDRGRPAGHALPGARAVSAGLDRRSGVPARMATAGREGRFRRTRRPRRPQHRSRAIPHRTPDLWCQCPAGDVDSGAAVAGGVQRFVGRGRALGGDGSPWTMSRCSRRVSTAARSGCSRRPGSRPGTRTPCGSRSAVRSGACHSTSRP